MKSELSEDFLTCISKLPPRIRIQARKNYRIWKSNPKHPSVDFKRVGIKSPVYSVRISIGWQALGLLRGDTVIWFWIGSHAEYDKLLKRM